MYVYSVTNILINKIVYIGISKNDINLLIHNLARPNLGIIAEYITSVGKQNFKVDILDDNINTLKQARIIKANRIMQFKDTEELKNLDIPGQINTRTQNKQSESLMYTSTKLVKHIETGKVYPSVNAILDHFGITKPRFYKMFDMNYESDYHFEYIEDKLINDSNNPYLIYQINEDNKLRYLGISNKLENEILLWHQSNKLHGNDKLYNSIRRLGIEHFSIQIIKSIQDKTEAEREYDIMLLNFRKKYINYNHIRNEKVIIPEELINKRVQVFANHKTVKKVRCIETNEIFASQIEACKKYNISPAMMCHALKAINHTAGKDANGTRLHWEHI